MFLKFKKLKMRNKEFYQIGQFDLMIIALFSALGLLLYVLVYKMSCLSLRERHSICV